MALPTGAGKTVVAGEIIHRANKLGHKSLFIVERVQLVIQAVEHLESIGLKVGILQGDNTCMYPDDEVVVCSIQTINSRRAPLADLVIIDEVHLLQKAHIKLMESWNKLAFIGLSATPLNPVLGKYFTNLIRGASVKELITDGYLVPTRAFCPGQQAIKEVLADVPTIAGDYAKGKLSKAINTKHLVGDIVTTWLEKCKGEKTLCFAVNVAHSKSICEAFNAEYIEARHIDGKTSQDERHEIIKAFKAGDVKILCSCNVLSVGFDVPDASCLILARPTLSPALNMQQMGRGLRPAKGKTVCTILDHAGNVIRYGLPDSFVVPDLDSLDTLTTRKKRKIVSMAVCINCDAAMPKDVISCPECGHDRPIKQSDVSYHDSTLVEYGSNQTGVRTYSDADKMNWLCAFVWIASHSKSGKIGAAYYSYKSKFSEEPPVSIWSVEPKPPTPEQSSWMKYQQIRRSKARQKEAREKEQTCPICKSTNVTIDKGTPPHDRSFRCGDCNHHRWLPKKPTITTGKNYV